MSVYKLPSTASIQIPQYPNASDFSTFVDPSNPDLDPNWTPIGGPRAVAEHVMRRWITIPGEMHDDNYGAGLLRYINASMLPVEVAALQAELKDQAKQCEGVDDINVQLLRNDQGLVAVQGNMTLKNGTSWRYVFGLSTDTIQLITLLGTGGA